MVPVGLAFMAQYFLAWFEYSTNYEDSGKTSFLPMFIALNGTQNRLPFGFLERCRMSQSSTRRQCDVCFVSLSIMFIYRYHPSVVGLIFLQSVAGTQ
jgi:hypothetical protein